MSKIPILIDSSDSSSKKVGINISSNSTLSDNFEVEGNVSINGEITCNSIKINNGAISIGDNYGTSGSGFSK